MPRQARIEQEGAFHHDETRFVDTPNGLWTNQRNFSQDATDLAERILNDPSGKFDPEKPIPIDLFNCGAGGGPNPLSKQLCDVEKLIASIIRAPRDLIQVLEDGQIVGEFEEFQCK